jgi:hypothetical protein
MSAALVRIVPTDVGPARAAAPKAPVPPLPSTYEELVACSPQGSIYAHRWWLEALAPGNVEIIEVRRGGVLQAAWPLVCVAVDRARHLGMPPLTQKLGILFAPSTGKLVEQQSMHQRLSGEMIAKLGEFTTFSQNFHENYTDWLPFHWRGYTQTTRYTYVLEDIADSAALWAGMRPHHRKAIRKAQRQGVRVRDELPLDTFIELYRMTFARQKLQPPVTDQQIRRIDAALCLNAGRRIFGGVDGQGRVHAAIYVAWADGTAYYLMGGSEPGLRESGAQLLAMWEAVRFAATVAKRFDFEGSMLPGVERAFRGFAAKQVPYFAISKASPRPETLREFLRQSFVFRWQRIRQTMGGK